MSQVKCKSRCPECAKKGKDKHHDNLVTYTDGHSYCFSCGYRSGGTRTQKLNARFATTTQPTEFHNLPFDSVSQIPKEQELWLSQYEITPFEQQRNKLLWSPTQRLLLFPIYQDGQLRGHIGRNFGNQSKNKWDICGTIKDQLYVLTCGRPNNALVFVEDLISAIKVSRFNDCCPIFQATLTNKHFLQAQAKGYRSIIVWLDPDKQKEAMFYATKAKVFGLKAFLIYSDVDPKECSNDYIKEKLNGTRDPNPESIYNRSESI